jgi:hypothetical protein
MNTSSTTHKGPDLLFADIPENFPVPNISSDVPAWNKLHESYYECFFAFAKSNLYDHGVLVHCASANGIIFYWAHTYDFYVAKDWFGMIDLDLQSPVVPSGVVSNSPTLTPLLYCISFHFFRVLWNRIDCYRLGNSASRVLIVLSPFLECGRRPCKSMVTTSNKMDGWMPSSMRRAKRCAVMGYLSEVLVKRHHVFFSILLATLTNKNDVIMDMQYGVGTPSFSASSLFWIFHYFCLTSFLTNILPLFALGSSITACRSLERHIVALESDPIIVKALLLPMQNLQPACTFAQLSHRLHLFSFLCA